MNIERIEEYTKRKELSAKAKKEVSEIIKNDLPVNKSEAEALMAAITKLHSDIAYGFFAECYKLLIDELKTYVVDLWKALPVDKATRFFAGVIGIIQSEESHIGYNVLRDYVLENCGGNIKKAVLIGYESASDYDKSNLLFVKFDWDKKSLNFYRNLLGKILLDTKKGELKQKIAKWMEENEYPLIQVEKDALKVNAGENADNTPTNIGKVTTEKKENTAREKPSIADISISELLTLVQHKVKGLCADSENAVKKNEAFEAEIGKLKKQNSNYIQRIAESDKRQAELQEKNNRAETEIAKLIDQVNVLTKEMEIVKSERAGLQAKLDNVESAFGQAGKNEVDSLKENISSRLKADYEKYLQVKDLAPDMDYYEILVIMLDEIFRVLKKSGINM